LFYCNRYNPATDVINLPVGSTINLNAVGTFTLPGGFSTLSPSPDQEALINMTRPLEAGADVIRVLYIGNFTSMNRGESFPDGWMPVGSTVAVYFVMIAGGAPMVHYVPAHEVGDMLTNAAGFTVGEASGATAGWAGGGHYGGVHPMQNVMDPGGTAATTPHAVDKSRRFRDDVAVHTVQQVTCMRGTRFIKMP
jgi:hypothetical protein